MIHILTTPIEIKIGGSGKKFQPIPADKYTVQISDVNPEESSFNPGEQVLNFEFVILDNKNFPVKNEETGRDEPEAIRGRRLWKRMRPSISSGRSGRASWLYKLLNAVEKEVVPVEKYQEINTMDLVNSLIGQQVSVMVNQVPGKDGNIYNNILDFAIPEKELDPFETSNKEQVTESEMPF